MQYYIYTYIVYICVGVRVGGAVSMNPPAPKDFPPLPPAPDEGPEQGDSECWDAQWQ